MVTDSFSLSRLPLIIFQRDSGVPHVGELADVVPPVKLPQRLSQIFLAPMVLTTIVAAFQYSKIANYVVGCDALPAIPAGNGKYREMGAA